MAKTIEQLKAQSAEVKNATVVGENTATRVGTLFNDIVEYIEQVPADETVTNKKLAPSAITNEKIANGAVTIEKLADTAIDNEPTVGSGNLVKSGGVEKRIELRKSSLFHINGENKSSLGFSNFNTEHFHFDMDFVILPNENNTYKNIVTIVDSNSVIIDIGYYTASGNENWYIGERLQSSIQYYKKIHLGIQYKDNLLCVSVDNIQIKTFSVSSALVVYFNRIPVEPTGEMLVNYLNFYDNQHFYGIDSITEHYSAILVDTFILSEIEIMRSEQFDQIGTDKVQWIDGTIGDILSLVFDENSLSVSSYAITYKDYVVTQPTITYNDDYQISSKPQLLITKSK